MWEGPKSKGVQMGGEEAGHSRAMGLDPEGKGVGTTEGRDGGARIPISRASISASTLKGSSQGRQRRLPAEEELPAGSRGPWVSLSCAPEGLTFSQEGLGSRSSIQLGSLWPGGLGACGDGNQLLTRQRKGATQVTEGAGGGWCTVKGPSLAHQEARTPPPRLKTAPDTLTPQLCLSADDRAASQWVLDRCV